MITREKVKRRWAGMGGLLNIVQSKLIAELIERNYKESVYVKKSGLIMINLHRLRTGEWGIGIRDDGISFTLDSGCGRDLVIVYEG
jgi:hypothetical protein